MGFFDRLGNLGKGWISLKRKGSDPDAEAEMEAELAGQRPPVAARKPAASGPSATPKPADAPDDPPMDEPRERPKKTL